MGQCMSRKAAGAFAASAAVSHNQPTKMRKHQSSPEEKNNKPVSPPDSNKGIPYYTKGVAMSFGFKRRPTTAPALSSNVNVSRRLANSDVIDRNGNENAATNDLTSNMVPPGRSTPRLAPPKKEANATRVSRFGFRQNQSNRLNKLVDLNSGTSSEFRNQNGNSIVRRPNPVTKNMVTVTDNNSRNRMMKAGMPQPQAGRFTLQSTHLPRPEPIRVIETKTAKTLANNNRRVIGMYQQHTEDSSSKEGSLTEDSGVGSHVSGYVEQNNVPNVEHLEASPTFGVRRKSIPHKQRNLEMVITGNNTFDVKDLDDSNDSCDSVLPPPLPQLPSVFKPSTENKKSSYQTSTGGLVFERTREYQKYIEWDNRGSKISVTSSEGFSDDYGDEEKTYKEKFRSEKTFVKSTPHKTFLKSRVSVLKDDSSPPSSDEHEWGYGGEAMADEISFSISSSDESKDKNPEPVPVSAAVIGSALQSLMGGSLSKSFTATASNEVKNVLLTIEDPKFAAVAAASNTSSLLDDETLLSPADSIISYSESDDAKRKLNRSSSNSKDVNEKLTPPTPGTPTNASNSLSLSDGKDDFLIDDEIADQPALVFEDNMTTPNDNFSVSQANSENTPTIIDSTPKPKRKMLAAFDDSPLNTRNKITAQNRTGSLDTLSPCESIASDDLMMDYDYSQSSGLDDYDRHSSGFPSLNDVTLTNPAGLCRSTREWNSLIVNSEKTTKSSTSRSHLLRSRTDTPNSVPDSPKSVDSRVRRVSRPSATSSPVRHRVSHLSSAGYESDDSIRLDRANHTAMKQDIISIKTMLLKLRRILNETVEDILLRSETHNPFENQMSLTNGLFNTLCPVDTDGMQGDDQESESRIELAELRRQVLFLQGQLEDKEKTVQSLQQQMIKLANDNYHSNSAPASTVSLENQKCNAATQTERIRPISAGPSLLNSSVADETTASLVSVSETPAQKSRPPIHNNSPLASKRTPLKLWRQPGESPSPQRYANSSIPRRATSRTRMAASTTS